MEKIEIEIRKFLIELAKNNRTTNYTDINEKFDLKLNFSDEYSGDRAKIGRILENILRYENRKKRPFLTIVVINRIKDKYYNEYLPSDKFYKIIKGFRKHKEDLLQKNRLEIFNKYSENLYKFWSNPINYEKYKDFK
ncbi:hypothetical protein ACUXZJ_09830 [Flavobacterium sp. TN-1]